MYGVRGANGVIVINTKRGKIGAPSVDIRVEHSISHPTQLPSFIGAADYMSLLNELKEDKNHLPYTQEQIDRTRNGYDKDLYPDVNWLDAITRDYAYSTRANLTVSGGSDFLRYSLVGSYFGEKGIMETDKTLPYDTGTKLTRYNLRANVDLDVTKTTTLRVNVGGFLQTLRKQKASTEEVFNDAFTTAPFVHPARYSDGTIPVVTSRVNPWAKLTQQGYNVTTASQIQSLFAVEQNLKMLTNGLKAKLTFSFDRWNSSMNERSKSVTYYNVATGRDIEGNLLHSILSYGEDALGHSNSGQYGNSRVYFEGTLTYNRTFGKHDVDALFLYNQSSYDDGGIQPYRKQGIAGRLSYTYDARYVAEFNFGYNGSENFDKGKRFGFFPSIAIGWLISEEPFMAQAKKTIDKLKIRGSLGKVGNDNIGGRRFAYITTLNTDADGWNWGDTGQIGRTGISEGDVGVTNLTWETALKANIGFELGLWNALELQVDFFREKRTNIFMQRKVIPSQTGFLTNPWANFGEVTNRGAEVSLTLNKQINKDWFVGLRSNFTYAINRVDEYDEPESVKGTYRVLTGRSLNTLWGLEAERLFTADDFDAEGKLKPGIPTQDVGAATVRPGDIKYKDMDGDGVVTDADEGYIGGTVDPRIVYGFGGNVNFKNWDLNFFFSGTGDTYRVIGGSSDFIPGSGQGLLGNIYDNYNDRWTEENPSQEVFWPRLSENPNKQNYRNSTWWKKNMRFMRLKTLELGYSLPKSVVGKIRAKNIRFYVSGNNLLCFSPFKLWDPELDTGTGLKYPAMRSVLLGVNLNF
jgi:TonB-linked SusC/RagA family outer membrane protein